MNGVIAHTSTTCADYLGGDPSIVLSQINYSGTVTIDNGINPGVFFDFFVTVITNAANQVVTVTQTHTGGGTNFSVHGNEVKSYTAACGNSTDGTETPNGGATYTFASPGTYVIGIKYDTKSISGTPVPVPHAITYTFTTSQGALTNATVLLTD